MWFWAAGQEEQDRSQAAAAGIRQKFTAFSDLFSDSLSRCSCSPLMAQGVKQDGDESVSCSFPVPMINVSS